MATDIVTYSEQDIPRFNPAEHIMPIKNKQGKTDYLPVQWRLVWANEQCLELDIRTKSVEIDLEREMEVETYAWNNDTRRSEKIVKRAKGFAKVEVEVTAVLKDGRKRHAEGVKTESAVNFADFVEKAQTGALGRALAMIGFGTQFVGDEFDERERIVDAPVDPQTQRKLAATPSEQEKKAYEQRKPFVEGSVVKEETSQNVLATEQQLASIRKLCQHLGKPEPEHQETMTYLNAKELIAQLSLEYRQSRTKPSCFQQVESLLDQVPSFLSDWCQKNPRWKSAILHQAFDIAANEPLPKGDEYTSDHVSRVELEVARLKTKKSA